MNQYKATTRLFVEYESPYDTHGASSSQGIRLKDEVPFGSIKCVVSLEDREGTAEFSSIKADSSQVAFEEACRVCHALASLLSLQIQVQNPNQHWGHPRVRWYKKDIQITPADNWPAENWHSHLVTTLHTEELRAGLEKWDTSPTLQFLASSYYAALSPSDLQAKFYSAFTIIEYLEKHYTEDIQTTPLVTDDFRKELLGAIEKLVAQMGLEKSLDSIKNRVGNVFGKETNTAESRALKLSRILNNIFGISRIQYFNRDVAVDEDLANKLIKQRNSLFHGGGKTQGTASQRDLLKAKVDTLILLCQEILVRLIKGQVVIKER